MIIDKQNLLSYKQAITATANSSDTLDLGPNHWAGASGSDRELPLFMAIDEVFLAAGAATLKVDILTSNDSGFGTSEVMYSRTFTKAELTNLGKMPHSISLGPDVKRYVRAVYTVTTGPFTAGKLTVGLTASRQTNT